MGDRLVYSTYLDGSGAVGNAIAVDSAGGAYVTGQVINAGFPTTPSALIRTGNGAFFTKLNAAGNALVYSTLLGSAIGYGVVIGPSGNAYITGDGCGIPITPTAYQPTFGGGDCISDHGDAYLAVLDPSPRQCVTRLFHIFGGRRRGCGPRRCGGFSR